MKLECLSCHSRYTIDDSIIPPQGAKIRCRKCGAVIAIPASGAPAAQVVPAPSETAIVPPSTPPPLPPISYTAPASQGFPPAPASAPLPPVPAPPPAASSSGFSFLSAPGEAHAAPAPAASQPASATVASAVPMGLPPEEKAKHEKARRLARVLASDIAIYNREKKDRGLAEGNLVAVLGYEIKKSWEIYKERVGADFANSTPYFRDALNDLLAEGKKIF